MTNVGGQDSRPVLFTTGELARRIGADLRGSADLPLNAVDALDTADEHSLSLVRDARHWPAWAAGRCAAAIVSRRAMTSAPTAPGRTLLIVDDADQAMIAVLSMLAPPARVEPGVHPSAVVDPTAKVDPKAFIGPNVVIGAGSRIGPGSAVHANSVIGRDVTIGAGCVVHPAVVIHDRCGLADHVVVQSGVVIGGEGFGYRPDPQSGMPKGIPHIGNVVIESHVEIGANSTIDRAKFGSTRIGAGTKIDNLVHIGHNCRIGRCCIICGMCGLSGSVTLGDGVTLAGGVGVADHITIGQGATVGARSGVMNDIPPGETWVGYPARPARETMRIVSALDRLPDALAAWRRSLRQPDTPTPQPEAEQSV